jgi:hypothetical protein
MTKLKLTGTFLLSMFLTRRWSKLQAMSGKRSLGYIALEPGSTALLNSARMPQQLPQLGDIHRDPPRFA